MQLFSDTSATFSPDHYCEYKLFENYFTFLQLPPQDKYFQVVVTEKALTYSSEHNTYNQTMIKSSALFRADVKKHVFFYNQCMKYNLGPF